MRVVVKSAALALVVALILAFILALPATAAAQIAERAAPRPFTPGELQYWSSTCSALEHAVPSKFKAYEVHKDDCNSFEWSERNREGHPITVENVKGEPVGNVPNFSISFARTDEDVQPQLDSILLAIRDAGTDAKKLTAAANRESRLNATRTLRVFLITNYHAKVDIEAQYAITTVPQKLVVAGASFATLYTIPAEKVMLARGGVAKAGAETPQKVRDKAVIVFGAPPKVTTDPADDNVTFAIQRIYTQDAVTNVTTQPVKNVVVSISGDAADIRSLIAVMDWKSIAALRK